jgi:hypothetical protein
MTEHEQNGNNKRTGDNTYQYNNRKQLKETELFYQYKMKGRRCEELPPK